VVGTPIGNLEDLSLRATRVLGAVSLVAAEDTRRTRALLSHLGVSKPMERLDANVEHSPRLLRVVAALDAGDVALCSDGGMPVISDPGAKLVQAARAAGHAVEVIPGPSAVTAALALAGVPADSFVFLGFLPRKATQMARALEALREEARPAVAFESPMRLLKALQVAADVLPERQVAVARELTKVHEELRWGTPTELLAHYIAHVPKGEITIIFAARR
jgi:16S rRNA (cytidine1402-2'-O)-methyltransferase